MISLWISIALSSTIIYCDTIYVPAGIAQSILFLLINTRFRLSNLATSIFYFGLFFEFLLSLISIGIYYWNPIYCVIFWIFFSTINKFGVENPALFNFYGKYSVYLGYACGSILLGFYVQLHNQVLLRYGALWILINMTAITYAMAYRNREQSFDREKLGTSIMVCLCSGCAMIDNSLDLVLPCIFVSIGFCVYETVVFFTRLRRSD